MCGYPGIEYPAGTAPGDTFDSGIRAETGRAAVCVVFVVIQIQRHHEAAARAESRCNSCSVCYSFQGRKTAKYVLALTCKIWQGIRGATFIAFANYGIEHLGSQLYHC